MGGPSLTSPERLRSSGRIEYQRGHTKEIELDRLTKQEGLEKKKKLNEMCLKRTVRKSGKRTSVLNYGKVGSEGQKEMEQRDHVNRPK